MSLRITRRDLLIALVATLATAGLLGATGGVEPELRSTAYEWTTIPMSPTDVGGIRRFFRSRTATLDELSLHVTTLNPGQTSHAPHRHANEEIVIIREGTVEVLVSDEWKRLGPGSVVFNASNELHALRNVGEGPTTYHVINWVSPAARREP